MSRHDRAYGVWHQPSRKGPGGRGRGVMKQRRKDAGMTRDQFAQLLRKLGITGRQHAA